MMRGSQQYLVFLLPGHVPSDPICPKSAPIHVHTATTSTHHPQQCRQCLYTKIKASILLRIHLRFEVRTKQGPKTMGKKWASNSCAQLEEWFTKQLLSSPVLWGFCFSFFFFLTLESRIYLFLKENKPGLYNTHFLPYYKCSKIKSIPAKLKSLSLLFMFPVGDATSLFRGK